MTKHIAVIGGGLAGTAAAYTLTQRGYKVTIVEKNDYIGGRIHSHFVDGAALEMGAGFIIKTYTNLLSFLAANGLSARLHRKHSKSGIWRGGAVRMATFRTLAGTTALSWPAKFQVLPLALRTATAWPRLDDHAFWKAAAYDERSVADMFKSRGGKEFLEYVLQPILNGYCYWTPEHTSEAMLLGMCQAALSHKTYKLQGGLQRIPEKAAEGSTVLLGHAVKRVERRKDGSYRLGIEHDGKHSSLRVDGIICATTASVVPYIFPDLSKQQQNFFTPIKYSSTALVARAYPRTQTRGDKGIAFPRTEGTPLSTITVSPEPGSGSIALGVVNVYASGAVGKKLCSESDKAIVATLTTAMKPAQEAVLTLDSKPLATFVQKWPEAIPMFDVGHFKRLQAFENGEIEDPTQAIVFAGDYLGGPFMEGAFSSGIRAAERMITRLKA